MNICFFDTETTGKPKNYKAHMTDVNNWPRVTQIAWQIATPEGELLEDFQSIVSPDNWTVPKEKFFIDNNMSTERCEKEGKPMPAILDAFVKWIHNHDVSIIVAHNLAFDYPVLGAEMIRYNKKITGRNLLKFCTMNSTTNVCKLAGKFGYKWPKLEELHRFLFECDFVGAHDASDDVTATRKCFFELVKRNLIQIPATVA